MGNFPLAEFGFLTFIPPFFPLALGEPVFYNADGEPPIKPTMRTRLCSLRAPNMPSRWQGALSFFYPTEPFMPLLFSCIGRPVLLMTPQAFVFLLPSCQKSEYHVSPLWYIETLPFPHLGANNNFLSQEIKIIFSAQADSLIASCTRESKYHNLPAFRQARFAKNWF